jgi:hypothetical protein
MSRSIFISKALSITTVEDVNAVFKDLDLGEIASVDMKEYERDGTKFRKFWIHYSSYSPDATAFMDRLKKNEQRQKDGEVIPAGDIPRIVYGTNRRTGNDMYWQVFACATPEQRLEEQKAKLDKPKVRIVM